MVACQMKDSSSNMLQIYAHIMQNQRFQLPKGCNWQAQWKVPASKCLLQIAYEKESSNYKMLQIVCKMEGSSFKMLCKA